MQNDIFVETDSNMANTTDINVRWGTICTPTKMRASDGKNDRVA